MRKENQNTRNRFLDEKRVFTRPDEERNHQNAIVKKPPVSMVGPTCLPCALAGAPSPPRVLAGAPSPTCARCCALAQRPCCSAPPRASSPACARGSALAQGPCLSAPPRASSPACARGSALPQRPRCSVLAPCAAAPLHSPSVPQEKVPEDSVEQSVRLQMRPDHAEAQR